MSRNRVLLLTASLKPFPGIPYSTRDDPLVREMDYYTATHFYLSKGYKVVLVDNSNSLSEKINNLESCFSTLEYLRFSSEKSRLGKSHGEVEIINYALSHSRFMDEVDYIVKITGRYIIKNIDECFRLTNSVEKQIYVNPIHNFNWADTRLMMMKKSFYYQYFLPAADKFLDDANYIFIENVYMKSLFQYLIEGGKLNLWPVYPCFQGYDGRSNKKSDFKFFKCLKYRIYYRIKERILKFKA